MKATERKVVTVLFADLANSTMLARQRDAEDLRALLAALFEEMAQRIEAFGGTVEKYAGDAIMAVFGVPHVHEDDAERAVRAAVAMQESLAQLSPMFAEAHGVEPAMRIGIATGEAVAATAAVNELMVTGEVANLAARLQAVASGIVVSAETYRPLASLLQAEPLGPLALKGFPEPVTAYRVIGLVPTESRPRGIPGLASPVVGRDAEMASLHRCLEDLGRGRGQIVCLVGEAGLGKSRLKIELRDTRPEGIAWLEGRCQSYTQTTSYEPIIQVLRAMVRASPGEPPALARTRLRAALRALVGDRGDEVQRPIAHLLGVDLGPAATTPLDPRALQSQLVLATRQLLGGLLSRSPAVLAVEDLHWADGASIELLTALVELTDLLPLMVLVTSRPDPEGAGWEFRFHVQRNYPHRLTEITLGPLTQAAADQLTSNLLRVADLPDAVRARILEGAEGNPFFVEEMIRSLIEQQVLRREGDRWVAAADLPRRSVPTNLRGLITARIDRLPAGAKAALQRAAVIGRFFSYRAFRTLADDSDLDRSLAHLLRAELIREWASLPAREYIFKHALTQEAAYESLLRDERRALHVTLATHLEETADVDPALLAHHRLRAEDWERALEWTIRAAERARTLHARPDAIAHYWQALELFERLPRTRERARAYVSAVLALAELPGWMRNEAGRKAGRTHLDAAVQLASERGDDASLVRLESLIGVWWLDEDRLRRTVASAEATGDPLTVAFATARLGLHLGMRGRHEEALIHIRRAIELQSAEGARYEAAQNMASGGRCYSCRAGRFEESLRHAAAARALAESLDDPRLRAWAGMEAEPYMYLGRWEEVVRVAEESLPIAWEIRELGPILWISGWLAIAYLHLGRLDDARRVIRRALNEGTGQFAFVLAYPHTALALVHLASDERDAALQTATTALHLAERSGFRLEHGAAHRALGQVHAARGDRDTADRAFRESLTILESIEAPPELAQTRLAYGLFIAGTEPARGRELIARALGDFEAMGASGWAAEARAALATRG